MFVKCQVVGLLLCNVCINTIKLLVITYRFREYYRVSHYRPQYPVNNFASISLDYQVLRSHFFHNFLAASDIRLYQVYRTM